MTPQIIQQLRNQELGRTAEEIEDSFSAMWAQLQPNEDRLVFTFSRRDESGSKYFDGGVVSNKRSFDLHVGRQASNEIEDLKVHFLKRGERLS